MQRLDINFLVVVAVAGALALQDVVEGAAVVVLFAVADWMETQCTSSARDAISAVLALKPEQAVLAETGNCSCQLAGSFSVMFQRSLIHFLHPIPD